MHRKWLVSRTNPDYIKYLSKAVSVSPTFAQVLVSRGIKTPQAINDFLNPHIEGLSGPFEIDGVKTVVERIKHAADTNETVLVHGDYDADGLTATAIMVHALRTAGIDVHYFIPDRIAHGYGFNPVAVKEAKRLGATLIITVDCGITSFDAASCAKKEGIDVIITDHHEPVKKIRDARYKMHDKENHASFEVPEALAIINPKLSSLDSPLSILSGAGLAFKIAQALSTVHSSQFAVNDLLDLAAIGTMADVVPLTGENRILVKEGMKLIHEGRRQGIKTLKSVAGLDKRELRAGLLSFTLIPRINAAGRISDASDVVRLLLSETEGEAEDLGSWLNRLNSERQKIEEAVYQKAREALRVMHDDRVIVLSGEGWHQGVVGIVASRIAEEFYRPTVILSIEDGIAKGSGRSIPSFDLCSGLVGCKEFLLSFGGHRQAAGVRLKVENIPLFEKAMQRIAETALSKEDIVPSLEIDADVALSEVNHSLISEIAMLEPVGCSNKEPFLAARKLEVVNPRIVGNNHLKMKLKHGSHSVDAIGFDMGSTEVSGADRVDAVFTPALNEYNGNSYLQLSLKALRPSS
ncbi:MAG: single-stranded-DNA-specific exonuclease RecJ [Thermodesulfovibrionales bacterium]|nr:single-stranded-DNA-specific exonuclease RecJ [Thermodesulfovibrionales bacterium]